MEERDAPEGFHASAHRGQTQLGGPVGAAVPPRGEAERPMPKTESVRRKKAQRKSCEIKSAQGGSAALGGIHCMPLRNRPDGTLELDEVENAIRPDNIHFPRTKLIALENTHNGWGGAILSLNYINGVKSIAKEFNLHMHLDGARVFNASVALNIDVKKITGPFDSIMFCLSKGLSSPIGSILAGTKAFIQDARKIRKFLGGGMRQVGILAAAGIVSIEKMVDRLVEDHIRAKKLADGICDLNELDLNPDDVVTNFIMLKLNTIDSHTFLKKLEEKKVLDLPFTDRIVRIVTHKDIDDTDIERAIQSIRKILSNK